MLSAIVCASAPGYLAVTTTVGGVRFGSCEIGRLLIAANPSSMMMIPMTIERTGRLMKYLLNIVIFRCWGLLEPPV